MRTTLPQVEWILRRPKGDGAIPSAQNAGMTSASATPAAPPLPKKPLLGVVHLDPLPSSGGAFDSVLSAALVDARALREGGVDGVVVENFGDAPFHRGDAEDPVWPDVTAALAVVGREIRSATGLPLGINCLRNDAMAALGAAVVAGATWVRVNVLTGASVTDQGLIQGDAARVADYRRLLNAEVRLLADLLVKHAAPLAPIGDAADAARDLAQRSGADGLIVSGSRTGAPVDLAFLRQIEAAVPQFPVWIGSGLTLENAAELWPASSGAIVGTAFKTAGRIDAAKVAALRAKVDSLG